MTFDNFSLIRDGHAGGAEGDLISALSLLIERLHQSVTGDDDAPDCREVVQWALAAAIGAERRISSLQERVARLQRLAVTDELTGLLNRRGFVAQLERALGLARRHGGERGVLVYVDLDGFKAVNDTCGHGAGDQVLRHVARLLRGAVRATDVVGRLGGDEFAVLLAPAEARGALKRAAAIETCLNSAAAVWENQRIPVRASVGALAYGPGDDADALLGAADKAMYLAKRRRLPPPESRQVA